MHSEHADPHGGSLIPRLLAGFVGAVCRRPWLTLTVAGLLVLASLHVFCTRIQFRTQRSDLINPHKDYQRRWRQYLDEFGNDEDMVVVVQGRDRERMKAGLAALADRVREKPELFDRLFYKVDLRPLRDRALLFLSPEEIQQVQDNLRDMGRLLDLGPLAWPMFTLHSLVSEAGQRVRKLPDGECSPPDRQFLTQLLGITRAAAVHLDDPTKYHNPWQNMVSSPLQEQRDLLNEPQYFFSSDGELAFLLVRPIQAEKSFAGARESVDALRNLVDEVRPHFRDLQMGVTGLPVLESDEMVASQSDTTFASWLALAGVTLLYFLVFRSFRSPLLTVGTLVVGTAWAMGWMTLTVGYLNILSATFAMMLIGLGDYGVLWVTRYDQERRRGSETYEAMRATAASVGPGILTAAITTSLAFFATMLADFQAVVELGWIAGCGVLLCALATFTFLPALMTVLDRRGALCPEESAPILCDIRSYRAWLPGLSDRPRWVVAGGLLLTLGIGASAFWVRYDHNLLHLQARGLESVHWELKLIHHTAGASWHALSYTATPEEALALKERYKKLPVVSEVVEVASLVPPGQDEKLEQLRDIQRRLRNLPARGYTIPHLPASPSALREELGRLTKILDTAVTDGRSSASVKKLLRELRGSVVELESRTAQTPTALAGVRLRDFEQRLTGDLAEDLHKLRDVSTPRPLTVDDLPPELRERYIGKNGKWLLRIFARDCLWDYHPLRTFTAQIHTVDPEATGKPFSTLAGLRGMKHGFQWAGFYALGVIVVVLLLDFRDPRLVLLALAPLAMGVLLAVGVMALCRVPLNPANMIAFPLIVGVGVDNGVHVLHDFLSRRRGVPYRLNQTTGRGILVAALTTILGFGTLMISSHQGLIGLGLILTLGVGCCMLAALVFLPAVLRLTGKVEVETVEAMRRRIA